MRIPLDDLNTAIRISVPFFVPFSGDDYDYYGSFNSRSFEDYENEKRSFSSGESGRLGLYREMEQYVGQVSRSDGHSCLMRAMCEVSANPHHEDGLVGKQSGGRRLEE